MATRYGYSGDSRTEAQKQQANYIAQRINPTSNVGSQGHTGVDPTVKSKQPYNPRTDPRSTVGTQENPGVVIKRPITVTDSQGNNKTVMQPVDRLMKVEVTAKSGAKHTVWVTQDVYNDPSPAGRAVMNRLATEQKTGESKGLKTTQYEKVYPNDTVGYPNYSVGATKAPDVYNKPVTGSMMVYNTNLIDKNIQFSPTPTNNPAGDKYKVNDPAGFYGSMPKEEGAVYINGKYASGRVNTIAEYERELIKQPQSTQNKQEQTMNRNIINNLQNMESEPKETLRNYFLTGAYNFKENSGYDKTRIAQSVIGGEYDTPSKQLNAYIIQQKENAPIAPPADYYGYQYFMASKKQQEIERNILKDSDIIKQKNEMHRQDFINTVKKSSSSETVNPHAYGVIKVQDNGQLLYSYDNNALKTTTLESLKPTATESINQASLVAEYYGLSAFKGMAIVAPAMVTGFAKGYYNTMFHPIKTGTWVLEGGVSNQVYAIGSNIGTSIYTAGAKVVTGTVTDRDMLRFTGKAVEFESVAASFGAAKNVLTHGYSVYIGDDSKKLMFQQAKLTEYQTKLKENYDISKLKTKEGFTLRPETEINIYDNGLYSNVKTGKYVFRIGGKEAGARQLGFSDFSFKYEQTIKFTGAEVRINTAEWAASDAALMAEKAIPETVVRYSNLYNIAELKALNNPLVTTGDLYGVAKYTQPVNIAANAQRFLDKVYNGNVMTGDLYGVPGFGNGLPPQVKTFTLFELQQMDKQIYGNAPKPTDFSLNRNDLYTNYPKAKEPFIITNTGVYVQDTFKHTLLTHISEPSVNLPQSSFNYGIPPLMAAVKPVSFAPIAFDTYNLIGNTLALGVFSNIGQGERIQNTVNTRMSVFETGLNKIVPITDNPVQNKVDYSIINQPITDTGTDTGLDLGTGVITGLGTMAATTVITKYIYQTTTNNIFQKEIINEKETIREYLPPEPNFYGAGGLFNEGSYKQLFKRVTTKYTPSIAAILYDIHGKVRGGKYSGAEFRPLPEERKHRRKAKGKHHK